MKNSTYYIHTSTRYQANIVLRNISVRPVIIHAGRSQDGFIKVWDLERRRVCAEFEATSHGMGVQRLDRLGRNRVVR